MSKAWIRVNATLLDAPGVRQFGTELLPKTEPWLARAAVAGFLVALWGRVAEHQPDGRLSGRDDEQLEEWAQWKGKPGLFAQVFRARFLREDGVIDHWEDYQGAALARREQDRKRKADAARRVPIPQESTPLLRTMSRRHSAGIPQESTRKLHATSNGTHAATETVTETEELKSGVVNLTKGEEPPPKAQPPAPLADATPTAATPSSVINRFVARFYGQAPPARRADIARQITGAILSTGVQFKGSLVRAVDADHLDDACLEVMEDPPREANAAWVFVLHKLSDTYLEVLSARTKALEMPRTRLPQGMAGTAPAGATPLRAALAGIMDGLEAAQP